MGTGILGTRATLVADANLILQVVMLAVLLFAVWQAKRGNLQLHCTLMTTVVVATCENLGWKAAAKGHKLDMLPEARNEYLGVDVMAFGASQNRWAWPMAAIELENSQKDDRIAYSLWKVLSVRSPLRIVFCYRKHEERVNPLFRFLKEEIVDAMSIKQRNKMEGDTLVVVGKRGESHTFPDGFFDWRMLDKNTGTFSLL